MIAHRRRWVAQVGVPEIPRELARHHRGAGRRASSSSGGFLALRLLERRDGEVVQDDQVGAGEAGQERRVGHRRAPGPVLRRPGRRWRSSGSPDDRPAGPAHRASVAHAGSSRDQDVMMFGNPLARGQARIVARSRARRGASSIPSRLASLMGAAPPSSRRVRARLPRHKCSASSRASRSSKPSAARPASCCWARVGVGHRVEAKRQALDRGCGEHYRSTSGSR